MNDIAIQRCFSHRSREAAARCPDCGRFFCRECVTEHDDRVICAACLRNMARHDTRYEDRLRHLGIVTGCLAGFMAVWLTIYIVGQGLLLLPTSFHEGTLWNTPLSK